MTNVIKKINNKFSDHFHQSQFATQAYFLVGGLILGWSINRFPPNSITENTVLIILIFLFCCTTLYILKSKLNKSHNLMESNIQDSMKLVNSLFDIVGTNVAKSDKKMDGLISSLSTSAHFYRVSPNNEEEGKFIFDQYKAKICEAKESIKILQYRPCFDDSVFCKKTSEAYKARMEYYSKLDELISSNKSSTFIYQRFIQLEETGTRDFIPAQYDEVCYSHLERIINNTNGTPHKSIFRSRVLLTVTIVAIDERHIFIELPKGKASDALLFGVFYIEDRGKILAKEISSLWASVQNNSKCVENITDIYIKPGLIPAKKEIECDTVG